MLEEEIWGREEEYFTRLYKADYAGVLELVHSQFLGWPSTEPQPLDKQGSGRFMQQLVPHPVSCTVKIERKGIRVREGVALTHYLLYVDYNSGSAGAKTKISRITHAWVKENRQWKLLGGVSA